VSECLFLAGATGGSADVWHRFSGWRVVGTTRSEAKAPVLRAMSVEPVVIDVYDADGRRAAVVQAWPSVVVHQLTELPPGLDPSRMAEALVSSARLRDEGTRNLMSAAVHAGARRLIAQGIAFVYARGPMPHAEDDPLDVDADDANGVTARGVARLERQVLEAPVAGGRAPLYGPGTGFDAPWSPGPVHVDAAAKAAELAVTRDVTGIYNIAPDLREAENLVVARTDKYLHEALRVRRPCASAAQRSSAAWRHAPRWTLRFAFAQPDARATTAVRRPDRAMCQARYMPPFPLPRTSVSYRSGCDMVYLQPFFPAGKVRPG
jgi:hypothetical protein